MSRRIAPILPEDFDSDDFRFSLMLISSGWVQVWVSLIVMDVGPALSLLGWCFIAAGYLGMRNHCPWAFRRGLIVPCLGFGMVASQGVIWNLTDSLLLNEWFIVPLLAGIIALHLLFWDTYELAQLAQTYSSPHTPRPSIYGRLLMLGLLLFSCLLSSITYADNTAAHIAGSISVIGVLIVFGRGSYNLLLAFRLLGAMEQRQGSEEWSGRQD